MEDCINGWNAAYILKALVPRISELHTWQKIYLCENMKSNQHLAIIPRPSLAYFDEQKEGRFLFAWILQMISQSHQLLVILHERRVIYDLSSKVSTKLIHGNTQQLPESSTVTSEAIC